MKKISDKIIILIAVFSTIFNIAAQDNIIDQVVWVVGDEAILKSDVESTRLQMQFEGEKFDGDPYCIIPEQLAVRKLFLHQAKIDSIDVPVSSFTRQVEFYINNYISNLGSKEKVEEYTNKPLHQLRSELQEQLREREIIQRAQKNIVGDVRLTPAEIRKFYLEIPKDSLPYIPTMVEVQIITAKPQIPLTEVDAVKNRLREFTERINKGDADFSTLAIMYSEDELSAKRGGELGFMSRVELVPEYASAAFALNDPKRISNVVESEYGFHIIQQIERVGDRINTRHILMKPKVPAAEMQKAIANMDSLAIDIRNEKFSFEEAVLYLSADKETRNNKGIMVNNETNNIYNRGTSRFEMSELPQEISKIVDKMEVGEVSDAFSMLDSKQQEVVAIVKLKQRINGHVANMSDDYQILKAEVESRKEAEILSNWVKQKIKDTFIQINDDWKNCDFQYSGWIK